MRPQLCVLVVHISEAPWENLSHALKAAGVTLCRARSCHEAKYLIEELQPEVVFSEPELPDGNWQRVLGMAERAAPPTNVIVVGKHHDMQLYVSAVDQGAYDFIAPPFAVHDISHMLCCAMDNAHWRRFEHASAA
jgi:DNA-binding NtrC family response regulator